MQSYLAVDIGASGGRHILGTIQNGALTTQEIYRFENSAQRKGKYLCWDADGLFAHVLEGLKECDKKGIHPVSVGIDTWGVDFALLDKAGNRVSAILSHIVTAAPRAWTHCWKKPCRTGQLYRKNRHRQSSRLIPYTS